MSQSSAREPVKPRMFKINHHDLLLTYHLLVLLQKLDKTFKNDDFTSKFTLFYLEHVLSVWDILLLLALEVCHLVWDPCGLIRLMPYLIALDLSITI